MAQNTTYLITGANRGIGVHLTSLLLLRPNTTVISTVRSPCTSTEHLKALPKGEGSKLIITYLSTSPTQGPQRLLSILTTDHSISHIDALISNAGSSTFTPLLTTPPSEILDSFSINTLLPITLFQTLYPLLKASQNPKFIYMSSYLGSIESLDESGGMPTLSYGVGKSAGDFFVRKVHFECPGVVAVAMHPGWIKTDFGQQFADSIGVAQPPQEAEDVVESVLEQIEAATRETTSGKFVTWKGDILPW